PWSELVRQSGHGDNGSMVLQSKLRKVPSFEAGGEDILGIGESLGRNSTTLHKQYLPLMLVPPLPPLSPGLVLLPPHRPGEG
ncbi:11939_t:CDS:1, partial [Acaulospora colombiana]